jgi:hypothetical protein
LAPDIAGAEITANNNEVCYACHLQPGAANNDRIAAFNRLGGDIHGEGESTRTAGSPGLLEPYDYRMEQLDCKVCHDPHGSPNLYWLKTQINDSDNITISGIESSDREDWEGFCAACHTFSHEPVAEYDTCVTCHFHGASLDDSETARF